MKTSEIGQKAENYAENYLRKQGLIFETRNYRGYQGEIDLIMLDKHQTVFIEVRYRRNHQYGSAADTITRTKQDKIIKTAQYYLATQCKYDKISYRFDVVAINDLNNQWQIDWIKNAFYGNH